MHHTSNFIKMMSPDVGGTDQVSQNRGYVAIPELGDQMMVGFAHHGDVGPGDGANNQMRSIQTKSGIKVLINNDEKSVNILDPSGNTYFMDGAGNITVAAPKHINFTADINKSLNHQVMSKKSFIGHG